MKETIEVPKEWIKGLFERYDIIKKSPHITTDANTIFLLGYIESAKGLLK